MLCLCPRAKTTTIDEKHRHLPKVDTASKGCADDLVRPPPHVLRQEPNADGNQRTSTVALGVMKRKSDSWILWTV